MKATLQFIHLLFVAAIIAVLTFQNSVPAEEPSTTIRELLAKQTSKRDAIHSVDIDALQFVRSLTSTQPLKETSEEKCERLFRKLESQGVTTARVKELVAAIGPETPEGEELMWPARFRVNGDYLRYDSFYHRRPHTYDRRTVSSRKPTI